MLSREEIEAIEKRYGRSAHRHTDIPALLDHIQSLERANAEVGVENTKLKAFLAEKEKANNALRKELEEIRRHALRAGWFMGEK